MANNNDWQQWIADTYHCGENWGIRITVSQMRTALIESRKWADPDDYVPDPSLASECAAYWNDLCDRYPN